MTEAIERINDYSKIRAIYLSKDDLRYKFAIYELYLTIGVVQYGEIHEYPACVVDDCPELFQTTLGDPVL